MLSDERINRIAMEYWSGTCGTRVPDMEKAIREALAEQAATHAIELRAYEATVENLEMRIRELEALMVPGGFPSDVMTAAGLVYHGKRDKVLAERLSIGAQSMLAAAPALKEDTNDR